MSARRCPNCERPIVSTVICNDCRHTLEKALGSIGGHYVDLQTVKCRMARYSTSTTRSSVGPKNRSSAMDMRFTDDGAGARVEQETRRFLARWVLRAMLDLPAVEGPLCATGCAHGSCQQARRRSAPAATISAACGYLAGLLPEVARLPWSQELLEDALKVERHLVRMVDRPADRWYAGVCGFAFGGNGELCERPLYVDPGESYIRCGDCGTEWDVAYRRDVLRDEAEDRIATAVEIARFVTTIGDDGLSTDRLTKRISEWASRDRLDVRAHEIVTGRHRPMYRIGDVLRLVDTQRRASA